MTAYPGSCLIECPVCGVRHEADGVWTEGALGVAGEVPPDGDSFKPDEPRCGACLAFGGHDVPPCLICGEKLMGEGEALQCQGCDASYHPAAIRAYALGLAAERSVVSQPSNLPSAKRVYGVGALTIRAAADLGIRRTP